MALAGLSKQSYYNNKDKCPSSFRNKYRRVEKEIRKILRKNPWYGYRRIKKSLKKKKIIINHKALKKLLKAANIKLKRRYKRRRRSGVEEILEYLGEKVNLIKRLSRIKLFQVIFCDYTRITYAYGKKVIWLIVYLEAVSKKVIGFKAGEATTKNALTAYRNVRRYLKRKGISLNKVYIHQDQGTQFTAYGYVGQLTKDWINPSFSRKGRFEDNPEMEAFNGQFKKEWKDELYEAVTEIEVKKIVEKAISYYNKVRIHSALGDCSPDEFIKIHQKREAKKSP